MRATASWSGRLSAFFCFSLCLFVCLFVCVIFLNVVVLFVSFVCVVHVKPLNTIKNSINLKKVLFVCLFACFMGVEPPRVSCRVSLLLLVACLPACLLVCYCLGARCKQQIKSNKQASKQTKYKN